MGNDDFSELIARLIISGVAIVLAVVALIYRWDGESKTFNSF